MTNSSRLDRANKGLIQQGALPPDGNTRGNIYLQTNGVFWVNSLGSWVSLKPVSSDEAYNAFGSNSANVIIDNLEGQGSLVHKPTGQLSFAVDLEDTAGAVNGFLVYDGSSTEYFRLVRKADNQIDLESALQNISLDASVDLSLKDQYLSSAVPLSESGETALSTTAQSLVGAINEVSAYTYDDIYNNESGTHAIVMDDGVVEFQTNTTNNFQIDISGSNNPEFNGDTVVYGFLVENGADSFRVFKSGTNLITVGGQIGQVDLELSSTFRIESEGSVNLSGEGSGFFYMTDGNLDIRTLGSGNLILSAADLVVGSNSSGGNLVLNSTANVTKGSVILADLLYADEANDRVGIGISSPSSLLDLQEAGISKSNTDILEITNSGNAVDMDGTETSILFNQYYYDASTPAAFDAARITVGTEQDATTVAATQDTYISFSTSLDGSVSEKIRIDSAGDLSFIDGGLITTSNTGDLTVDPGGNFIARNDNAVGVPLRLWNQSASGYSGIEYLDNGGTIRAFNGFYNVSSELRFNNLASSGYIDFLISSASKLRVLNNGKVRVGVSPSTYIDHSHDGTDYLTEIGSGSCLINHLAPVELADDGSFDLPDATAGFCFIFVGDAEESARFTWDSSGTVDLIQSSANMVNSDTDGNFCIFDNGTQVRVRNRLGASKKVIFDGRYWTP